MMNLCACCKSPEGIPVPPNTPYYYSFDDNEYIAGRGTRGKKLPYIGSFPVRHIAHYCTDCLDALGVEWQTFFKI
jgi:hypothetical protein